MTVRGYRASHLSHHAYLGTTRDQDRWAFALDVRGPKLWRVLGLGMFGYYGLSVVMQKYLRSSSQKSERVKKHPSDRNYAATRWLMVVIWHAIFLGLAFVAGRVWVYPLLWLAPLLTVGVLLNVVRSTAEHQPGSFETASDRRCCTARSKSLTSLCRS